ncbi:DapH/DapD/GlmU-related protein [Hymenobacter sp. B1770]|uniref:acyltransferase n=1 Tax=Hymenobacter sp. B1770 TaxID=1718788 RepID=UPI003CF83C10
MKFNNRNIQLGVNVRIGKNVRIGDNTTIYDNVEVGDNTIVANDCVIGEPQQAYYFQANYTNPETKIGANSFIRSHAIIYAGSTFGEGLTTGHRITVREGAHFGTNCLISTMVDIQGNATFGNYCRLYSNVHICEFSRLGNHVFIFPYTIFTNDSRPPSNVCIGPTVGDYTIIAVHSVVLPGVNIGSNCLIGSNSVVSRDVLDYSFAVGSPAKVTRDIREIGSREKDGSQYPWMYNFERGMPWQGIGFDAWLSQQQK